MLSNLLNINLWKFYRIYGSLLGIEIQDKENKKWVVIDFIYFFGKGKRWWLELKVEKRKWGQEEIKGYSLLTLYLN